MWIVQNQSETIQQFIGPNWKIENSNKEREKENTFTHTNIKQSGYRKRQLFIIIINQKTKTEKSQKDTKRKDNIPPKSKRSADEKVFNLKFGEKVNIT